MNSKLATLIKEAIERKGKMNGNSKEIIKVNTTTDKNKGRNMGKKISGSTE